MTFPDFEEFIALLNEYRVRYLIVGGYAVGFHARPRATKDIDILIDLSKANARRARVAIVQFLGADAPNITEEKLTNPRTLIVLGVEPIRIDILTTIDGLGSFAAAWKRRAKGAYGKAPANYIALEDLITAKSIRPSPRLGGCGCFAASGECVPQEVTGILDREEQEQRSTASTGVTSSSAQCGFPPRQ